MSGSKTITSAGARHPKKIALFAQLQKLAQEHSQVIIVEADHVGSNQMDQIRLALRGKATIMMAKNTMVKKCLGSMVGEIPELEKLIPLIVGNVGLVFCKDDVAEIRKVVLANKVPAPAKAGSFAPCAVTVPAGGTGMDPGQTSFFQVLQIPTKIVKGQIEIQSDVALLKEGDKVTASQAALLQKLNICPFSYGLKTSTIYEAGTVYPSSVLDIDANELLNCVAGAVSQIAAFGLASGLTNRASAPHTILKACRNVGAFALESGLMFPAIQAFKDALAAGPVTAAVAAPAATAAAAAAPESDEESDAEMGFSLFD